MTVPSDFVEEMTDDGVTILRFSGDLSIAAIGDLPERLREYDGGIRQLDLSDIGYIDTVGAWLIHRTARDSGAEIVGADNEAERLIVAVSGVDQPTEVRPEPPNPVIRVLDEVGESTMIALTTLAGLVGDDFCRFVDAASGPDQMECGDPAL